MRTEKRFVTDVWGRIRPATDRAADLGSIRMEFSVQAGMDDLSSPVIEGYTVNTNLADVADGYVQRAVSRIRQGRTILDLSRAVELRLVDFGVNPAGPDRSVGSVGPQGQDPRVPWKDLYRFDTHPAARRPAPGGVRPR